MNQSNTFWNLFLNKKKNTFIPKLYEVYQYTDKKEFDGKTQYLMYIGYYKYLHLNCADIAKRFWTNNIFVDIIARPLIEGYRPDFVMSSMFDRSKMILSFCNDFGLKEDTKTDKIAEWVEDNKSKWMIYPVCKKYNRNSNLQEYYDNGYSMWRKY